MSFESDYVSIVHVQRLTMDNWLDKPDCLMNDGSNADQFVREMCTNVATVTILLHARQCLMTLPDDADGEL